MHARRAGAATTCWPPASSRSSRGRRRRASRRQLPSSASRRCRRCCASRRATRSSASSAGAATQWEAFTGVAGARRRPARAPARAAARRTLDPDRGRRAGGALRRQRRCAAGGSSSAELEDEVEAMFDRGWTDGLPGRAADRGPGAADARGHDPRARRGRRRRPARPRRVHGREGRGQRGAWPAAGPSTCRSCSPRSRRRAPTSSTCTACWPRPASAARSSIVNGPIAARDRHEQRASTPSARATGPTPPSAGRCSSSSATSAAAGPAGRPGHARQPGQVHVLLRRGRGGLAVGAAVGRARASPPARRRVTLFAGEGPRGVVDQLSPRRPSRWPAPSPRACGRWRTRSCRWRSTPCSSSRPSTRRVFREAGWDQGAAARRARASCCSSPATSIVRGAGGIAEGVPEALRGRDAARSSAPAACCIVHAGGGAGLFSAIIGGWVSGDDRQPARDQGGAHMSMTRARPDRRAGARRPASRWRAPGRRSTARPSACSTSPSRGATSSSTGSSRAAHRAGRDGRALPQADVHQAGAGRPAPRDRRRSATW